MTQEKFDELKTRLKMILEESGEIDRFTRLCLHRGLDRAAGALAEAGDADSILRQFLEAIDNHTLP
jgi:hypothetical protein